MKECVRADFIQMAQDRIQMALFKVVTDHRWAGHVARMEELNAYRIFVGKPEGKRPLGGPSRRWVNNIKIDLREIGWDGMEWIDLFQDRNQWRALVITVMSLRVP
jgi:hypothetical protein